LQRIPFSEVARIDIVRAGAGGIDMGGYAVVANVVRVGGASTTTIVEIEPRFYTDGSKPNGAARLDWSRQSGPLQMSAAIAATETEWEDGGHGSIMRLNPDGSVRGFALLDSEQLDRSIGINGAVEYHGAKTLYRANGGYTRGGLDRDEPAYFSSFEYFRSREDSDQAELGVNIERKFADRLSGRIDALQTYLEKTVVAGPLGRLAQTDSTAGESNLRGVLTQQFSDTFRVDIGAEGAFNYLDQTSALASANANVRIEERRAQPFVTMNWQAAPWLATELGARYERSIIRQIGDTNLERTFEFFKPRLIASANVAEGLQIRLRIERQAKQLDFKDFAASSGAAPGTASAGNASLKPERAWQFEIAAEKALMARSALVVTYLHEEIKETWDYVAIGSGDGKGNVGDGTRDYITADLKMALDPLGLKGVRIEAGPQLEITEVIDPFTGDNRPKSGTNHWRGRGLVILDQPRIDSTFTLEYRGGRRESQYRLNQIQALAQRPNFLLTWEWTPRPDLALRFLTYYVSGRERDRVRDVFAGPRGTSPLIFHEHIEIDRETVFTLRLRKKF
jgi:hypothetical protein